MSALQFTPWRSLAMLLLMSVPLFATAADERGDTQQLKASFQVTVRQGPSAGLVANGVLTLNIHTPTGNFTGTLTPAEAEGAAESSVLFHQVDHKFVPFGDVKQVDVRGTIHGHAINLVALNAGGEGKDIFGVGATENAFGDPSAEHGLGHISGPAVGPEEGDSGDWLVGITILPIPFRAPPLISSANTTTFLAFTANAFAVSAFGVPLPAYSETGTLPSGVTFGANGVLSGNPTQTGTFPITITASNGVPPDAVQNFTLVVSRPPTTFTSVLSPAPIIVAAWSFGSTGTCTPVAGRVCPHTLSMTVNSADKPGGAFGAFVTNAAKQESSGGRFSGTLALGDITIVNSANMFVSSVSLSGAGGSPAATITIVYE